MERQGGSNCCEIEALVSKEVDFAQGASVRRGRGAGSQREHGHHHQQRRTLWIRQILPSRAELPAWIALTCLASISEEITYRGLLFAILSTATGSVLAGTLLTAISFGAAHAPQGLKGAITIGVLSLILQALVILTGSLVPAMAVHAIANVIAGVRGQKRFRDLETPATNAIS
jgi:hypothetical protein